MAYYMSTVLVVELPHFHILSVILVMGNTRDYEALSCIVAINKTRKLTARYTIL